MRKVLYGLGLVAAIVVLIVVTGIVGMPFPPLIQVFSTSCKHNDEIPANERSELGQAGLRFVQALLSADPESAHSAMSAEAQRSVSRDQFPVMARQIVQSMAPFDNLHVADTYLVNVTTTGNAPQVICEKLGRPEDWVAVASLPIPKQGHVIIEADGRNNGWSFVLWLVPEQGWRVNYFHFTAVSIVDKSAQDFWTLARSEHGLGHNFNAALLYPTAAELAYRGPNIQLGIQPEIQREMAALERPTLLQGQPPFIWQFGENRFRVLQVGPIGVSGKIYLTITHEISPWTQDADADRQNRELIREFKRAVPEYSTVFAGLVVAAQEKGGHRGYRTVDAPRDQPK